MAPDASEHGIVFGSPADNNHGGVYYTNADGLSLRTGGNFTRMAIDDLGNVGIGTAGHTIDARLHVESDNARVAKFDRYTSDGQLVAWARDDGVVGDVREPERHDRGAGVRRSSLGQSRYDHGGR
jgi:hypothetical protein